ncbi:type IV pilus biogenesis protein PilP [Paraburkholderia sp.]|uniref:type IV pilus biogenesis protein PilP n=1 Tax=Paraburkholderia sp. TaxID=1926495 RepID=UPI003D6DCCE0
MKNDRLLRTWALVCCVTWPVLAHAQAASTPLTVRPDSPATASGAAAAKAAAAATDAGPSPAALAASRELMGLQEDTVILKAQLKKLEAQAEVAARQDALGKMGRSVTNDEIAVVATQSLGSTTTATLNVNDSSEVDVHAGDMLPNGMRVISIRPGAVVIDSHGTRTTLTVSATRVRDARMVATSGSTGMSMGTPPIPTIPMPGR